MHNQQGCEEDSMLSDANIIALYDRYGQIIFAYIRAHALSREDAEDMTMEVFMAALEHDTLSTFLEEEQLAWLKKVARNKLIDSYRRHKRRPAITLDQVVETIFDEQDPEQVVLQHENHGQLQQCIQQLPALQQQLLNLRYGYELSCPEIAVLVNKRDSAVRKLLSRTITLLRKLYTQYDTEGERKC